MTAQFLTAKDALLLFFPRLPSHNIEGTVGGAKAYYHGLAINLALLDGEWWAYVGDVERCRPDCREALLAAYMEYEESLRYNLETLHALRG